MKHFKLPALGVAADGYFNDFGLTNLGVGQATSVVADQLRESNDAPGTGGRTYNEVNPSQEEEEVERGARLTADPAVGDHYNSWIDSIEKLGRFDVPDVIEKFADGGLRKLANSAFGNWLAEGGVGAKLSLGFVSMLASNALLDKVVGDSLMSGVISLGIAGVTAFTVPNMMKDFAAAGGQAQEVAEHPVVRRNNNLGTAAAATVSM